MTPEFEKWMDKTQHEANCWEYVCSSEQAHFWLTRIFSEIEREADALKPYPHSRDAVIGSVFAAIKSKFGL